MPRCSSFISIGNFDFQTLRLKSTVVTLSKSSFQGTLLNNAFAKRNENIYVGTVSACTVYSFKFTGITIKLFQPN